MQTEYLRGQESFFGKGRRTKHYIGAPLVVEVVVVDCLVVERFYAARRPSHVLQARGVCWPVSAEKNFTTRKEWYVVLQ